MQHKVSRNNAAEIFFIGLLLIFSIKVTKTFISDVSSQFVLKLIRDSKKLFATSNGVATPSLKSSDVHRSKKQQCYSKFSRSIAIKQVEKFW